jgi:hypothetical protein
MTALAKTRRPSGPALPSQAMNPRKPPCPTNNRKASRLDCRDGS